jgi:hypothetical protein
VWALTPSLLCFMSLNLYECDHEIERTIVIQEVLRIFRQV